MFLYKEKCVSKTCLSHTSLSNKLSLFPKKLKMIGSQSSCFLGIFTIYFIFFFLLPLPNTTLASPSRFLCGRDQRDALLEVKEEFPIHTDHDSDVTTISWNKSVDCCSWDGVKCDANFGEVISLNLVSNFANTSLKSSSGLFKLQHLTHLDLSDCYLQGEIPSSIGNLSHLTFLDLSSNYLVGEIPASIGNLNNLRYMKLSGNDLIGNIPTSFANFTKLSVLNLNANQFRGGDIVIANLTSLSEIDLSYNHFKSSITADLSGLHNLEQFLGDHNSFVGLFPSSLLMISSLVEIDLSQNQFVGHIDFGNTSSSSKLGALDVGFNDFDGPIPKSISKLRNINDLDLSHNNFGGRVPSPISELANLFALFLSHNNFGGRVPSSIGKLRNLQYLDLSHNNFGGRVSSSISELANLVPSSIGKLRNLQYLDLSGNNFGGRVPSSIGKLQNLNDLNLSHNNFGGRVPSSISKLVNLSSLDLSYNKLEGQVPHFTWRSSPKYNKLEGQRNLSYGKSMSRTCSLDLSHNLFSSFGKSVELDDESSFMELYMDLDLSSNSLQGPIPQWICNFTTLKFLDLSNNQITGTIPQCLKNSSILNLQNNSLSGFLPDFCMDGAQLRSLDVSHNNLKGKLPKSLLNCTHMEFLNVRGNKIKDTFPFWLGSLPRLNILVLQSNAFYGPVYNPSMYLGFSSVRIIDISNNNFDGSLPQDYFANWTEMSLVWDPLWRIKYDRRYTNIGRGPMYMGEEYINKKRAYSIDMVYKGVDTDFVRIFKALKAIDFSGNRFYGDIPRSIGLLSELRLLNLAGNAFTGSIPPFLANITNLETLDLSRNNLSGEIPQGLGNLSFLSYINFSNNHLQGLVPQSTQFVTQKCSSFMGNPGLYGLEKICKDIHAPIPTSQQPKESSSEPVVNWIAAAIAFGPGVFCGLVIGHIFTSYKHEWFIAR